MRDSVPHTTLLKNGVLQLLADDVTHFELFYAKLHSATSHLLGTALYDV